MARSSKNSGRSGSVRSKAEAGEDRQGPLGRVLWLVSAAAWLFVTTALVTHNAGDPPTHTVWPANDPVANLCGPVGAFISYHLFKLLGLTAWALLAIAALGLWSSARGRPTPLRGLRLAGVLLILAAFGGLAGLLTPDAGPMPGLAGGTLGAVAAGELSTRFGVFGSSLFLLLGGLIGLIVAYDAAVLAVVRWTAGVLHDRLAPAAKQAAMQASAHASRAAADGAKKGSGKLVAALGRIAGKSRTVKIKLNDMDPEVEVDESVAEAVSREGRTTKKKRPAPKPVPAPEPEVEEEYEEAEYEDAEYEDEDGYDDEEGELLGADEQEQEEEDGPGAPQVFDRDQLREKISKLPVRFGKADSRSATEEDLRDLQTVAELEGYRFPGLDLLEEPEENFSERLEELVREQAEALESALRQYRIDGEVVGIESGPVITLYHVRLAPGTRVSALQTVSSDIARSLMSTNIRIVSNQAGRDTVGVEVPNPTKEKVRLKELMADRDRFNKMRLPMFLGKDAAGDPLIADLTKMPHMLIAGTTGSGKSVCMNTIIMSFLYTKKPNELKLVLVDPKMVEMSQFKDIPHLMCPVVTEMSKAAAILEWACRKMDERYELLAEAGCRDIASYNDLDWDELKERFTPHGGELSPEEEARIPRRLPYMVFIIDELADLMMTAKEVEGSIIRIAQKARAVGIHLILATQRPQANVVTGLIKSNMPCRVSFKVASGMDSRIVLDQKGGELLLGQGDMLFLSPSSHKLSRAQGTLMDDGEIRKVVRFMRDIAAPTFERSLVQIRSGDADEERLVASENNSSASLAAAQEDPLFDRAVEIVLETGRGSVSLLQRRLAIGYTRSSRLIDLMGIAGILGEHKGSVAREVLISIEEWDAMKRLAEEEAADTKSDNPDAPGPARSDLDAGTAKAEAPVLAPGPASDVEEGPTDEGPTGLFDPVADRAEQAAVETHAAAVDDDDAPFQEGQHHAAPEDEAYEEDDGEEPEDAGEDEEEYEEEDATEEEWDADEEGDEESAEDEEAEDDDDDDEEEEEEEDWDEDEEGDPDEDPEEDDGDEDAGDEGDEEEDPEEDDEYEYEYEYVEEEVDEDESADEEESEEDADRPRASAR
ncbi:MAG: DNA translocase FtsK 4TM domain-containing protein [Planctomycetota bacterium]